MKLPWNKKYLIIGFHIVITLLMVYVLKYCIDAVAYVLTNLKEIFSNILNLFSWLLSVFSVVVIAFVISYLLDPLVNFFQNKWEKFTASPNIENKKIKLRKNKKTNFKSRTAGVSLTYLFIFGFIFIVSSIIITKITKNGGTNFIESLTIFINKNVNDFSQIYNKFEEALIKYGLLEHIYPYINKIILILTSFVNNIGNVIINFVSSFASGIVNVLISIVIAFYFLKDKEAICSNFNNFFKTFLPKKVYKFLYTCREDTHEIFSGYIRGQLLDASIMAILISSGLSLIKLKFSFIIGIIAGFSNIIPYFGALMGFVLAISVAILSGQPIKAVYASLVMLILQQIDTVFIVPKVVGESVELSPVLVIIALSVAGHLFGLWGMVFAVPVFATLKLFFSRIYLRKLTKDKSV